MAAMVREAAATVYGVPVDWVMAANGSDEMLALLAGLFSNRAGRSPTPCRPIRFYITLAEMQAAATVEVPYDEDYNLPVEGLAGGPGGSHLRLHAEQPSATVAL